MIDSNKTKGFIKSNGLIKSWVKLFQMQDNNNYACRQVWGRLNWSTKQFGVYLHVMKKEIEIARLKKGYMVKGVGAEKEFVTTFDKNTK